MKISLNTIRYYNKLYGSAGELAPDGVEKLAEKIGAQLGAIEEIIDVGSKYEGALIVKVVSCVDHPNADRLHVCMVDDGGQFKDVERDEKGHVQIVCGAPNVREGMLAVWLPPGMVVPSTADKDPFALEVREIRGVKSNGMMASAKELAIGDSHEGILEVDIDVAPGTSFAEAYNLVGEVVIDIENKMFTHRPDCFGFIGIARELAGIQQQAYKSPDWYTPNPSFPPPIGVEDRLRRESSKNSVAEDDSSSDWIPDQVRDDNVPELKLVIKNEIPELVPRFTAIAMRDIEIKPSPVRLQILLSELGLRPINNIVDYSNYFMLLTSQPIHIYDYDKVKALSAQSQEIRDKRYDAARLTVRHPKNGEKITLLNGKTIEPGPDTMMVATDRALACIGGAMGGADTEISDETKNIIIEAATWDMYQMRRTSMQHGIFTDAVTRFTKGQSPLQNKLVIAKIVDEIRQFAGGKVASELIDDNHVPAEVLARGSVHPPVEVTPEFINARLGLNLSADEIKKLLENVEFKVEFIAGRHSKLDLESSKKRVAQGDAKLDWIPDQVRDDNGESVVRPLPAPSSHLLITAPFWRTDIEIPEDIVEEVGRLYGFDHLPLDLPKRDLTSTPKDPMLELKSKIRDTLSKAGANEVLTYSFVHGNLLDKVGQDKSRAFQIANALSPDLQYYRLSLTPSLLEKVHPNIKTGHHEFALFEMGKAHQKESRVTSQESRDEDDLPREFERVAFVFGADNKANQRYVGATYYQARKYLTALLNDLDSASDLEFLPLDGDSNDFATTYYEPGRAATIRLGGATLGRVGEYKASVRKALKLPDFCAGFELGLVLLASHVSATRTYVALPRFPKVEQDICLKVAAEMSYQELENFVVKEVMTNKAEDTHLTTSTVDIYQREDDKEHKQITFRLSIASYERTLTDAEVSKLLDQIAAAAKEKFGAERI